MTYKADAPFALQIELCEGCNLRCSFCGLNGIRGKDNDFKFMSPDTLTTVLEDVVKLGWNPRIEFANHGEPTMHPAYADMIKIARQAAPKLQLMMTSNGGGLLKKPGVVPNVAELFRNGLNVLALDNYEGIRIVDKMLVAFTDDGKSVISNATIKDVKKLEYLLYPDDGVKIYSYPKEPLGNPHMRRPLKSRVISIIQDISKAQRGTHSLLNNHAGAGAAPNDKQAGKRCAKPFRELSIRWNGDIAVCCNDWRGIYKCGNAVELGVGGVWYGAAMNAARRMLYQGQRTFGPCKGCDARSYRTGLLPDKLGKQTLREPDAKTMQVIKQAIAGDPYTKPVLRPWEIKKNEKA